MWEKSIWVMLFMLWFNAQCCATVDVKSAERLHDQLTTQSNVKVVDVRSSYDFQKGHIPGAVNAPYNAIDKAGLAKGAALVLYCSNDKCPLSHFAAKTLERLGYTDVSVLSDGITGWTAKGYALETPDGVEQQKVVVKIDAIAPDKLRPLLAGDTVVVLDVRPAAEFAIAHLPGARNVPAVGLAAALNNLDTARDWVLCGRDSAAVSEAAQLLAGKGYKVRILAGGIQIWSALKYPLKTGE